MTAPVAQIHHVRDGDLVYEALMFWCPGCEHIDSDGERAGGLHMLAVNSTVKTPSWEWDGNLEAPSLTPSIKTENGDPEFVCHSYLKVGVFQFLDDCTHQYRGQHVPLPPLPDWALS